MAGPRSALVRRVVADARTRMIAFALLLFAIMYANAAGYRSTYPNATERAHFVVTFADNKAALIFYGTGHDLTTVGGYVAWRAGGISVLFAAVFGMFAAARALRGDEEAGRTELVLVGALTRRGVFTSAISGIAVTIAALWLGLALGIHAGSVGFSGAVFLALDVALVALVYTGIGAVANQLAPTRRGALGLTAAVFGADFALRIIADTADHPGLHWFAPLGWAEEARAFSGSRLPVLLLPLALSVVLIAISAVLNAHRDLGGAYLAARDTAPPRTRGLSSPTALALRLERLTLGSWIIAILAFGLVIGSIAKTVEQLEIPQSFRDQIAKLGGIDVTSARGYVGLTFVIFVFAIALFVCSQFASFREDESARRLETVFALPYGRARWLSGRLGLAIAGAAACALGAAVGIAIGVVATGAHMAAGRAFQGALNVLPAEILFVGIGALCFALAPRVGVATIYGIVIAAFVLELFGALLSLPAWMLDLSPFHHVAPVPARPIAVVSALAMTAIGVLAMAAGVLWFRARDLAGD